ncbi:MAG: PASTA domain-containing protein [Armatimonadota bacterium]
MTGAEGAAGNVPTFPAEMDGRYELLERLGRDLLTTAYRARDRVRNRIVVVRFLRDEWVGHAGIAQGLQRGVADTLAFRDTGVVPVVDLGACADGRVVFVEDVDRGSTLADRVRHSAPFPPETVRSLAVAIADAVGYAHSRGLAHGDLRSERVLVGGEPSARVGGFGQAAAVRAVADIDPATLATTVATIAPEVATLGPTMSGDVYALGVMMYEMLVGRAPFLGNPVEVALQHARTEAPRVSDTVPGTPSDLDAIVARCLAKAPGERFADGRALAKALRQGGTAAAPSVPESHVVEVGEPPTVARIQPGVRGAVPIEVTEETMPRRTARPVAAPPQGKPRGASWLTIAMMASAFLLVGSIALVFSWVKPLLTPATTILVPNLVGMPLGEAEALARERGFSVQVIDRQFRSDPPADVIYQMRDKIGVPIRTGQPVAVWVSKGPEMVEVPDVARMRLDKAREVLERAGLKLGVQTRQYDFTEAAGNVIEQAGLPGQRKPRGTAIDVVVSKGPEPQEEPVPEEPAPKPAESRKSEPQPASPAPPERVFSVPYKVPDDGKAHQIRIDVEDGDGLHTAYDESVEGGKELNVEVTVSGKRYQIRLYDNDVLKGTAP